jgi:hypothetical protein
VKTGPVTHEGARCSIAGCRQKACVEVLQNGSMYWLCPRHEQTAMKASNTQKIDPRKAKGPARRLADRIAADLFKSATGRMADELVLFGYEQGKSPANLGGWCQEGVATTIEKHLIEDAVMRKDGDD